MFGLVLPARQQFELQFLEGANVVYLIVKGQIDPIENENAPEIYKANKWQKLLSAIMHNNFRTLEEAVKNL